MEKQEFITQLKEQIALAESEKLDKRNVLDLRGARYPYHPVDDSFVTEIDNLDFVWEFLKDANDGYVEIYENLNEAGYAVCTDYGVSIENNPKESKNIK